MMRKITVHAFILAAGLSGMVLAWPGWAWIHGIAQTGALWLSTYGTHAALVSGASAPTSPWTIIQTGFTASGDGGAATYDWNASSYCPGGTSGAPTSDNNLTCILPAGQSASTPGRYLLRLTNGVIDARQLGFRDDGSDNASLVATLNTILKLASAHVVFSASRVYPQANYWFSQPLDIANDGGISCDRSTAIGNIPSVNLVFIPATDGVRFDVLGLAQELGLSTTIGVSHGDLHGCGVVSTGAGAVDVNAGGTPTVAGSTTVQIPRTASSFLIANGQLQAEPVVAIGDSLAMFPLFTPYWYFSGYINGSTLTVTTAPTSLTSTTDPGIRVGQMLQDQHQGLNGMIHGIFIAATHAENPTYTGTGGTGTYGLNYSIAGPPIPAEAIAGGTLGSSGSPLPLQTEVQSGPPMVLPGTTVTACTTNTSNQCPFGGTMTLGPTSANAPTLGMGWAYWLLPGPNSAKGNQQYNVTTSQTGNIIGSVTASITGGVPGTMTVSGGPGNLKLGQTIVGTGGGSVSTTTTAALTLGENASIPVSSCTGVTGNAYIIGTSSGNSVFAPGTTVNTCSAGSLSVNTFNQGSSVSTTSGSNVVQAWTYYIHPANFGTAPMLWVGEPITGTNIPANTTIQSWAYAPYDPSLINLTLSNPASGTNTNGAIALGGATFAAPSGTTLTFFPASATGGAARISATHAENSSLTGTGGNGTYQIENGDQPVPTLTSSTLYAYDTPSTVYISGGPRNVVTQDLIWTDAFPFGSVAARIYGVSPTSQTIIVGPTGIYGELAATATHAAGAGKMWVLPSGIMRGVNGTSNGNITAGWGVGLNMSCAQNVYPETGCGQSKDENNRFLYGLVGRLTVGNNAGSSMSINNEYDHNYVADFADLQTIGETVIGEEIQGHDESKSTHAFISACGNNGSPMIGIYDSGSEWASVCNAGGTSGLVSDPTLLSGGAGPWIGNLWNSPYSVPFGTQSNQPQTNCAAGAVSLTTLKIVNGVVTHC